MTANSINWLGMFTLYKRESMRFLKVWNQTIIAPVVTTLLFLAIFTLALDRHVVDVEGIPFEKFIMPGLVMMAVVQNAFANSSSSLMLAKVQGVIIDILIPPLNAHEIVLAYMLGGLTRGIIVGIGVWLSMCFFVDSSADNYLLAFIYIILSAIMLSLCGILCGIWAQTFDQMSAITNYIITPLAFLSGTFYSVKRLPEFWQMVSVFDPFFYMISGFRYAITGYADINPALGIAVIIVMNVLLYFVSVMIINRGYRLKS